MYSKCCHVASHCCYFDDVSNAFPLSVFAWAMLPVFGGM